MRLVVMEHHELPIINVRMWIKGAGAIYDPPGKEGLASLTADLLDEGTDKRSSQEIAEEMEFVGGELDSGAGYETTGITLSVLVKDLDLGLDLMSEILLKPSFPEAELSRLKRETISSIIRSRDNPRRALSEAFRELVYGDHPYHRSIEGYPEAIESVSREDVIGFYRSRYLPGNAIVVVVGDVRTDDIVRKIDGAFKGWAAKGPPLPEIPMFAGTAGVKFKGIDRNISQAYIVLGRPGITRSSPDYNAVEVMNYILGGGGFSSRLTLNIRSRQGLVYNVGSDFSSRRFGGIFTVSLETKNESAEQAIESLMAEIERMRDELVSEEELKDAKSFFLGSLALGQETIGQLSGLIMNGEYNGLPDKYWEKDLEEIKNLTAEDISRVAKKYLDVESYVLVVVADLGKAKLPAYGERQP
jgi:zinc protease